MRRWPQPDFLARGPRRPRLAWLVLATGGLACALGATDLLGLRQDLEREARQLARLRAAEPAAPREGARPNGSVAAAATAQRGKETLRVNAAWQVQQRLAYRWELLFAGVESASPPGVQWLALEHDGERADVRLDGRAPDVAAALQAVEALAACEGWGEVALRYVGEPVGERGTAAPEPRGGLRFELAARLAADPAVREEPLSPGRPGEAARSAWKSARGTSPPSQTGTDEPGSRP